MKIYEIYLREAKTGVEALIGGIYATSQKDAKTKAFVLYGKDIDLTRYQLRVKRG